MFVIIEPTILSLASDYPALMPGSLYYEPRSRACPLAPCQFEKYPLSAGKWLEPLFFFDPLEGAEISIAQKGLPFPLRAQQTRAMRF
jgi:hypothetical protein